LSLLTRSGLPLPETLRQLADNARPGHFQQVLQELGTATAGGNSLADAMRAHPDLFSPFHVRMVAVGLKSDSLPSVLAEIARVARIQYQLTSMLRGVLAYPLLTTSLALLLFLLLNRFVIPAFAELFEEMLPGECLPMLTNLVLALSQFVCLAFPVLMALFLVYLGFCVWLLSDLVAARRCLLRLASTLPFANVVFYNLTMARFCSLWAVMMKQSIPEADSFPEIARLVEHPAVARAIERVGSECALGQDLYRVLRREKAVSKLVVLTLENSSESERSSELSQLADLFLERAVFGFRWVEIAWETAATTGMGLAVGTVLLLLFAPVICELMF
jgi:MSHA biogenesis protein MshG